MQDVTCQLIRLQKDFFYKIPRLFLLSSQI